MTLLSLESFSAPFSTFLLHHSVSLSVIYLPGKAEWVLETMREVDRAAILVGHGAGGDIGTEAEASLESGGAPGSGDRASRGTDSRGLSTGGPV